MSKTSPTLNLQAVLDDLFLVLTTKEKEVVVKRFSLDGKPRQTLERIGKKFGVTRERIRQIEKIALNKLRRTSGSTPLYHISEIALELMNKRGGVMTEKKLVDMILEMIPTATEDDRYIVQLALSISSDLIRVPKSETNRAFYYRKNISKDAIRKVTQKACKLLEKNGDVLSEGRMLTDMAMSFTEESFTPEFMLSTISTDKRIKKVEGGYGLIEWRHVNPKSIRDKALIILKKANNPLHFEAIAKEIEVAAFDKKKVTIQAVHNELIRYEQFVLVGRGLYALKEWGYSEGTVADIIENLLGKQSPLTKKEITSGVLEQRHVKKGTISLNLQKNPHFVRVGRALYSLDLSKKPA